MWHKLSTMLKPHSKKAKLNIALVRLERFLGLLFIHSTTLTTTGLCRR